MQSLYDVESVRFMWEELKNIGITPLTSAEEVDNAIKNSKGTSLVIVNSVCGCVAGHARPGVGLALQHKIIPDNLYTVFAGVDREATERAREYMPGVQPSSPSITLFKNGEPVYVLHRSMIEASDAEGIARKLILAFDDHCEAEGPSVAREIFENNFRAPECSSTIPLNTDS